MNLNISLNAVVPNLFSPVDQLGKAENPPALVRMREGWRSARVGAVACCEGEVCGVGGVSPLD